MQTRFPISGSVKATVACPKGISPEACTMLKNVQVQKSRMALPFELGGRPPPRLNLPKA